MINIIKTNIIIIIIILSLFSCKNTIPDGFYISDYDKNGNIIEIFKNIKDTIIQDSSFSLKYKKKYDSDGNLLNEGIFAENNRFGKHLFYKKNELRAIKDYVFFNKKDSLFLFATNSFRDSSIYKKYTTYLNSIIVLKDNGDTSYKESSFIDINYTKNEKDSINFKFTAYDSEYTISAMDLYFYYPNNDQYEIIIHKNSNIYNLKLKKSINKKYIIKGYAIITVFNVNNSSDTIYRYSTRKLNKHFKIY